MNAVKFSSLIMLITFSEDLDLNIVSLRTVLFAMITSTTSDTQTTVSSSVKQTRLQHFLMPPDCKQEDPLDTVKQEVLLSYHKHHLKAQ